MWQRAPWWPGSTIWLSPPLEAAFAEDCRRGSIAADTTAPVVLNTLRWVWKRALLDRRDAEGRQRGLVAARKHQTQIGSAPDGYAYQPPSDMPPDDPRIKQVRRRATAFELAAQTYGDRSTKAKARRRRSCERQGPAKFDTAAFIAEHWQEVFAPLAKRFRLGDADIDGPIGARLAATYHAVLAEQEQLDGAVGPAFKRWQALLRELKP